MRSRRAWAAATLAALAAGVAGVAGGSAGDGERAPARPAAPAAPGAASGPDRLVGPTDPARRVEVSLVLRMRAAAAAQRVAAAVNDPSSPDYRRFVDPAEIGRRYGLPGPALARLRADVKAAGLEVVSVSPQRSSLRARGAAGDVARLFATRLADYRGSGGRLYHAPVRPPVVPRALAPHVTGVTGLSDKPVLQSAAVPAGGLGPAEVVRAYNLTPLRDQGLSGQRGTVAIVSFDSFQDEDVEAFDKRFNIKGPPVEHIPVAGGTVPGPGQDEVNLDIDVIRGIAPDVQILNYEAPNGNVGFDQVIDKILADDRTDLVSISWGVCEPLREPAARELEERSFAAAAAAGVSIFVASGDGGAYDCQHGNPRDRRVAVDWPSASPNVIAVGGTRLSVRTDGSYLEEAGWEDVLSLSGGGGGLSRVTPRPAFQRGPGVDNAQSNGRRQIPDVAATADPDSGYIVVRQGQEGQTGGTSGAAPFWAGSMVLVRQFAQREKAGRLGYLNPLLYELGASRQPFPPFHDVLRGGNRLHDATPGWDYATGLGSPDVFNLARSLVARLKR